MVLDLILGTDPDLLVLQECVGWEDRVRLRQVARVLGLPDDDRHGVLGIARPRGSGKRYHVALLSRLPIDRARMHNDPHFIGHCLLEAQIGGITLFAAHFDSHHENLRFVEARYLRSLIDPDRFATCKYLLAGDLNSLSARDPYRDDLAERVLAAGTNKFGHPPRFEVIEELEAMGWIDLLHFKGAPSQWITARRNRGGVHIDYRTDYLFASPTMARSLKAIKILDAKGTSDHNPVVADLA